MLDIGSLKTELNRTQKAKTESPNYSNSVFKTPPLVDWGAVFHVCLISFAISLST